MVIFFKQICKLNFKLYLLWVWITSFSRTVLNLVCSVQFTSSANRIQRRLIRRLGNLICQNLINNLSSVRERESNNEKEGKANNWQQISNRLGMGRRRRGKEQGTESEREKRKKYERIDSAWANFCCSSDSDSRASILPMIVPKNTLESGNSFAVSFRSVSPSLHWQ